MSRVSDGMTVGARVRQFRKALPATQKLLAQRMVKLAGTGTRESDVSDWERGKAISPGNLTVIAMLHPHDPRGCLEWLRGKRKEMPGLHGIRVDRGDPSVISISPTLTGEKALQIVSQVCGLLRVTGACSQMDATLQLPDEEIEPFEDSDSGEDAG